MNIRSLFIILLAVLVVSCGKKEDESLAVSGKSSDALSGKKLEAYEDTDEFKSLQVEVEAMGEVINNLGSPIEVASLLSDLEIPFSISYLSDPDKMSNYASSYEMAYNLGALSSDLGYLNMYNKTGTAINFLTTINKLADALEVGQFFDFVKMKRLATNDNTFDSLLFVSTNSFNNMDSHLMETDQNNLSSLMVAGVWIEGLYLATQVYKKEEVEDLKDVIANQKKILNYLIIVLHKYKEDSYFRNMLEDYLAIKEQFDKVKVSTTMEDPEEIEIDGYITLIQNEIITVDMSDETLSQIIDVTKVIRNKHLKI